MRGRPGGPAGRAPPGGWERPGLPTRNSPGTSTSTGELPECLSISAFARPGRMLNWRMQTTQSPGSTTMPGTAPVSRPDRDFLLRLQEQAVALAAAGPRLDGMAAADAEERCSSGCGAPALRSRGASPSRSPRSASSRVARPRRNAAEEATGGARMGRSDADRPLARRGAGRVDEADVEPGRRGQVVRLPRSRRPGRGPTSTSSRRP